MFEVIEEKNKASVYFDDLQTVHPDDIEPVQLIQPDLARGPWIAGGAVLKWYQGKPVGESDIDVFCQSPRQAELVLGRLADSKNVTEVWRTKNAISFNVFSSEDLTILWRVQIIVRNYYQNLEAVLNNFDISICQIGTAGYEWVFGPETAKDIRLKHLRFVGNLKPDCAKRLTKYITYGYRPSIETIESVIAATPPDTIFSSEEYTHAP